MACAQAGWGWGGNSRRAFSQGRAFMDRLCQGCGCLIRENTLSYRLRVELFASPDPPAIRPEDLEEDLQAQWKALIETMEQMSADEVEEATDQVHESYEFVLCRHCRQYWHDRFQEYCRQLHYWESDPPPPTM